MSVNVTIDTSGLTTLVVRLRNVVVLLPSAEDEALAAGAALVARDARNRASKSVKASSSIRVIPLPPLKGNRAFAVGAGQSGGDIYPLLREGGNGNKFRQWKHPTFGHEPEVVQNTDPYLTPALEANVVPIVEGIELELDAVLDAQLSGVMK